MFPYTTQYKKLLRLRLFTVKIFFYYVYVRAYNTKTLMVLLEDCEYVQCTREKIKARACDMVCFFSLMRV